MKLNENYSNLKESYLFAEISKRKTEYIAAHPDSQVISLGIGDVTRPLCPAVVEALKAASLEMGSTANFRGYGPYEGYEFLRKAIAGYYLKRNVELDISEIFVSDGAKNDLTAILDIFSRDNTVLIPDPVYPVYVDSNIMDGRKILYMNATAENDFLPLPDESVNADIIYLCSPNNPTGTVYDADGLKKWVDYANSRGAVILFDAAYEAFVGDDMPHSIYEVEGAKTCAIEFCSLSKTASFTGTRCGYTIIPHALGKINRMWYRNRSTKYNGTSYIIQRGAEAFFSDAGQREAMATVAFYKENAKLLAKLMKKLGIWFVGGKNSPYIWLKCPNGMDSWEYFDYLLSEKQIVSTPGAGFGKNGEGYLRLTAFGSREDTNEAIRRLYK